MGSAAVNVKSFSRCSGARRPDRLGWAPVGAWSSPVFTSWL